MPYSARTESLPDAPSFNTRMSCRDATDFMSNIKRSLPMISRHKPGSKSVGMDQAQIDMILARSKDIQLPWDQQSPGQPLSDLVPGLVISGGRSRSPAFDGLPVVSHWGDRTGEASAADPAATVCLTSTWFTSHVLGEGSTMQCPLGAPCWSLKTHGIGPVEAGSSVLTAAANISWGRNTRVADAVDRALELLADAAVLLAARNKVISTGVTERLPFAAVHAAPMPTWCVARKPLPPKLSGVAHSLDPATTEVLAAENCVGPLLNTSIFSMAVGYNRGVYGGSISGLWAIMDSAFVLDYSIGKNSPAMAEKLAGAFADVAATAEAAVSAGPHITDIRVVKGRNYACLRQKTIIEDTATVVSRPCMVVWDDLARLARYKLADAVFCHVYYDSGGGEQMAAMAGLGCVVHDWIDLGADLACGEISNIIPTLTQGALDEGPLAEVYSRLVGAMIWYRDHDPYNPAALCILFTHWWQLANCRHRPITLLDRTDLSVEAMAIAATIPTARPSLEHFRACGTPVERGEGAFAAAEARFNALLASNPLAQTRRVADLLVRPVLAYVRGTDDHLPLENEYVGAVLAAEIAYPQDQKIRELWDLAIVMWECGALWAAGVAGLCYTHSGQSNCDRAREDLSDCTWS
ncbi:uncharacterized protein BO95DRAFT_475423 [Aspergillus brunneoviolaceus CBS 621.78]|uniref:Uncharacterized protein n=1 Tax=Aspergillus brunneoviolaceus CBS 621.78 TaxID=1450534 RepID=A0ACD1G1A6_9EURO|nr:hypothetical protein BO95DRAFT_475423 [Aspergillus brunneoviolaceus CBS 621.78]RAH43048.1 hypothetical protein BO95DRAFT_475423 [Aspergillus brunneoviolaceus CBS 621.78]